MTVCGVAGILCLSAAGCRSAQPRTPPSIEFTRLPPAGEGSPDILNAIEGRVTGARPGQRIVLFARSGVWWVQPVADRPFTTIGADSRWKSSTHPGNAYAALLVNPGYNPPLTVNDLPRQGGPVEAVVTAEGSALVQPPARQVLFSGYEWQVRQTPGNPGGSRNQYDPGNVWVDQKGFLHLRIARGARGWSSAEAYLSRSLGYGSYRFVVGDVSPMEPAAALTISAMDDSLPYNSMDIEISRWGEPGGKNAQYVIQPYFVPANVVRFLATPGTLTYSFDWEPGRVAFQTIRESLSSGRTEPVAAHVFTSGVPTPGKETIRLNLFVFENKRIPLQHGLEVTFEKFEYLP